MWRGFWHTKHLVKRRSNAPALLIAASNLLAKAKGCAALSNGGTLCSRQSPRAPSAIADTSLRTDRSWHSISERRNPFVGLAGRQTRQTSLPDCVATIAPAAVSATPGLQAVDTLVKRCITAVERRTPYKGAIPCSICGARSIQDGRDDDGRRHYDETEHDCLLRPRSYRGETVSEDIPTPANRILGEVFSWTLGQRDGLLIQPKIADHADSGSRTVSPRQTLAPA